MKRCQRIVYLAAMVLLLCAGSAFAQSPALFFTDLESGPKTGGQNNKGAFVTIYGTNFGATQGASSVTVGGGVVDNCPVWGATWLWYQKITCQLGPNAATGNIVVTVDGATSNTLPFTVRAGNVFFVNHNTGSDSNDGSFAHPWKSIIWAKGTLKNGDIAYLRAGTWSEIDSTDGASSMVLGTLNGVPGSPKAILGYPGETATIACVAPSTQCFDISARSASAAYWTFGELDLGGNPGTIYVIAWDNGTGGDGLRLVGNKVHDSFGTAIVLQGPMNGSYILGNDVYHYWALSPNYAGPDQRGYGLYYGGYGTQQNINILYNRFMNDQGTAGASTKGIQIYGHTAADHFKDVTIANNQILNNCMEGIAVGGSDSATPIWQNGGSLNIYNNLIAGNGACDTINALTYSGMQIGDSWGGMQAKIWNNTFYLNAGGTIGGQGAGDIYMYIVGSESFDVSNNIFYGQPTGQRYNGYIYQDIVTAGAALSGTNNLFFPNGNAPVPPTWVTNSITGDPKFVAPSIGPTADFHLQTTSPAKNAGAALSLVNTDLSGTPRPQETAYDIGAYEFGFGSNPPPPPPPPPPAPTATSGAAPSSIAQGQSAVLAYGCSNCTSVTINGVTAPSLTGQMDVTPAATTTYSLTALGAGGSATATATVTVTSGPPPPPLTADLGVSVTHTANFTQGQSGASYVITVSNVGSGATSGTVTVTDTLPAGLTATAISGSGWSCTLSTLRCTRSDALAAGANYPVVTLTGNVSSTAAASVTNTAIVSGGGEQNVLNNTANDLTNVTAVGPADLAVAKTHTGNFVQAQSGATYAIVVSNVGGTATSGTITAADTLPTGLTATAISGTGWTCTLSTLRCTRSTVLTVGASYPPITVTVNVASTAPSSVTNTATVSGGGEQNTANDTASDLTNIVAVGSPDLSVSKMHAGNFTQGQTGARYTITVSNTGGSATSGTVTVTDALPTGLTATAISGTGWTCTLSSLRCTRTTALAPGVSYPAITVTVNVASTAANSLTNTATVSGGGEQNTANDTASDVATIVTSQPDLVVTLSHGDNFMQGQVGAIYSMIVSNIGTAATAGTVTLTDALPAGLTATAISGTGWTCTLSTLRCTRSSALAPGLSYLAVTLTVKVSDSAPASAVNTATVSGGGQQNTSNDTDSDLTDIISNSPTIGLSPELLQFTATVGDTDITKTVQGQNLGGGILGWTATVATDSGVPWLVVGPTSGVAPSTLVVTARPTGLAQGTYTGRIILTAMPGTHAINSPQTLPVQLNLGASPQINNGGIVNGASFATDGANSPGSIAVLFGQGMASGIATAVNLPLPMGLLGTQVLVNGITAPLYFVSPTQINFQMPFEVSGSSVQVVVVVNGVNSPPVTAALAAPAPGIFSATSNGSGQGAVLNENGTPNSAANPAAAGSVIAIYLTGMGNLMPALQSGQQGGSGADTNMTLVTPTVLIGGSPASDVQFSGAAPGFVGLNQINVRIPAGTAPGTAVTLQIQAGDRSSNTVTIAVR